MNHTHVTNACLEVTSSTYCSYILLIFSVQVIVYLIGFKFNEKSRIKLPYSALNQ